MKSPIIFSPAHARQTKERFAEQNDYLSYELGKAIQELPPLYTRLLAGTISLLIFGGLTWAYHAQVDEVAIATGKIIPSKSLRPVRAITDGIIREVKVKAGEQVKKDAILLEKDDALAQTEINRLQNSVKLIQQDIARLNAEKSNQTTTGNTPQDQLLAARRSDYEARRTTALAEANKQLAGKQEAKARLSRLEENLKTARITEQKAATILEKAREALANSKQKEEALRILVAPENQAIPRLEYVEVQNQIIQTEAEVIRAENELVTAQDKVVSFLSDIAAQKETIIAAQKSYESASSQNNRLQTERQTEILTRLNQRQEELAYAVGQLDKAKKEKTFELIKAPIDGTVYEVKATRGPVQKGEDLLSILPSGDSILLEAKVLNRDIGFINPGDPVKIKLTTFPFQEFGTISGTVLRVDPNATVDEENKELGLVYKTTIELDKKFMIVRGKEVKLVPGMTATADIVTRQKSVLTFFIEPITRRFSDAFSVR
ncbi:HlyD family efflux transporter periplasmic adaptor subunit [Chroococcus sp. FPU101]|uniref:HlyD family efflux transporter periplasmic adaptor subunit n=1 Tax=Chroococcus sp. FPU101 TaxID=1974212 RepID=UPI001A8D90C9|nr:HlyD family efflux transporter periplasmic adaptor subunit [Chroococcus sp. FPU101]GFE67415.1 secretion protein HlyD [Chroococcus sp. FPU101]